MEPACATFHLTEATGNTSVSNEQVMNDCAFAVSLLA